MPEILFSSFISLLCGFKDIEDFREFSLAELVWLKGYFAYDHGIANVSTYQRVFHLLDNEAVNAVFMQFMHEICPISRAIALDGKGLLGSKTEAKQGMKNGAQYIMNALCHETGLFWVKLALIARAMKLRLCLKCLRFCILKVR